MTVPVISWYPRKKEVISVEKLASLIEDYVTWVKTDGGAGRSVNAYLGLQTERVSHPNHTAFYEAVGTWVEEFLKSEPEDARRLQALKILLFAASDREGTGAVWYLVAIQNWAKPIIAGLSPDSRQVLGEEYGKRYPRGKRLPLQKEICKMLKGSRRGWPFAR